MNFTNGEMYVIAGMTEMVEKEGKTPHEAVQRVRELENQIFFALMQLKTEEKR